MTSHYFDLLFFQLKWLEQAPESFVKHFIYGWRTAHPDSSYLPCKREKLFLYVFWSPARKILCLTLYLRESHHCLEIFQAKPLVNSLKCFNHLETNCALSVLERYVQMEAKFILVQRHLFRNHFAIGLEAVLNKQLGNKIKEYKSSSACTESHMDPRRLDLQSFAHRSLDKVTIFSREVVCCRLGQLFLCLLFNGCFVDFSGQSTLGLIRFQREVDGTRVLTHKKSRVEFYWFTLQNLVCHRDQLLIDISLHSRANCVLPLYVG